MKALREVCADDRLSAADGGRKARARPTSSRAAAAACSPCPAFPGSCDRIRSCRRWSSRAAERESYPRPPSPRRRPTAPSSACWWVSCRCAPESRVSREVAAPGPRLAPPAHSRCWHGSLSSRPGVTAQAGARPATLCPRGPSAAAKLRGRLYLDIRIADESCTAHSFRFHLTYCLYNYSLCWTTVCFA